MFLETDQSDLRTNWKWRETEESTIIIRFLFVVSAMMTTLKLLNPKEGATGLGCWEVQLINTFGCHENSEMKRCSVVNNWK